MTPPGPMAERATVQSGAVHDRPRRQNRFLLFLRPRLRPHRQPHPGHPAAGVEHQTSGLRADQHLVGFGSATTGVRFSASRCRLRNTARGLVRVHRLS